MAGRIPCRAALLTVIVTLWLASGVQPAAGQQLAPFPGPGESFTQPFFIAGEPADPGRIYVVEGPGTIQLVKHGVTQGTPFLDIRAEVRDMSAGEGNGCHCGMFSMAFAPDYETSGRFYVFFTRVAAMEHDLVIKEFRRTTDPDDIDEATGRDVLVVPHPTHFDHNGGQLQFGPDGYLYISTGDGWNTPDLARDLGSRLGKILRIDPADPSGAAEYSIPPDNPFADGEPGGNADEIYSYGLRNPYRFSFDRLTGDLTIADVGADAWEEIDFVPTGGGWGANFGWDCWEGIGPWAGAPNPCDAPPSAHTPPVHQYENPAGGSAAINGGYVVRDATVPSLLGRYVYADTTGALGTSIHSIRLFPGGASDDEPIPGISAGGVVSFGEDACGHVYVAQFGGEVSRIQQSAEEPACAPQLSLPMSHPPGQGSGADAAAPRLSVDIRKGRRAARRGGVTLVVQCDEPCTVWGGGRIVTRGAEIRLGSDMDALQAGARGVLHLELTPTAAKRLLHALSRGHRAKVVAELGAVDAAGNRTTTRRRIPLAP